MRPHDNQINAAFAGMANDLRGRIALKENVTHGDAGIDRPNLFQLLAPVGAILIAAAFVVNVQDCKLSPVVFGQGHGVEIRLVGVARKIGRVENFANADHAAPSIGLERATPVHPCRRVAACP